MNPEKKRRHSPFAKSKDTVLVEFTAVLLPHDSPEFQERAKRQRPEPRTPQTGHPNIDNASSSDKSGK